MWLLQFCKLPDTGYFKNTCPRVCIAAGFVRLHAAHKDVVYQSISLAISLVQQGAQGFANGPENGFQHRDPTEMLVMGAPYDDVVDDVYVCMCVCVGGLFALRDVELTAMTSKALCSVRKLGKSTREASNALQRTAGSAQQHSNR